MTTIHIAKIDESTLRVTSDDFGIEQEMQEHFSFFVPGYKFMPLYRNKVWDGKAKLYDMYRKTLPYGLLEYVKDFALNNDYSVSVSDELKIHSRFSLEETQAYIESLQLVSKGNPIKARDYQVEMVHRAINKQRVLALSPTSSGKSLSIYAFIRWQVEQGNRVILMVPTTMLVAQMYSDFEDYSSQNGWDVESNVHQLYSGKEKKFDKPVLITTWQSVHSIAKKKTNEFADFFSLWDVFVGDEAHLFASNSIQDISKKLVNAKYRLGTTGTIQDDKVSKLTLEGSFGPVYKATTTKKLMDANQVTKLKIKCITLKHSEETRKLMRGADYQKEIDYIVTNNSRNKFIAKLAKATKGNTLVLFKYVDKQGKPLYQIIKDMCPDRPVFYISGEVDVNEREAIRKSLETHTDVILCASYATLSTGVNAPSIENVIFASPVKSKITNLQSIGRGLRLRTGKDYCTLFDISDDLSVKSKTNHTLNHLQHRIEQYTNEQFEFDLINVQLN